MAVNSQSNQPSWTNMSGYLIACVMIGRCVLLSRIFSKDTIFYNINTTSDSPTTSSTRRRCVGQKSFNEALTRREETFYIVHTAHCRVYRVKEARA